MSWDDWNVFDIGYVVADVGGKHPRAWGRVYARRRDAAAFRRRCIGWEVQRCGATTKAATKRFRVAIVKGLLRE
jgi:hypothetical protein